MFYQVIEPDCGKRTLNVDAMKCGNETLSFNDGPSLLNLLSSFYDRKTEDLQVKLNKYLEATTSARVTFIVLKMPLTDEYSVQVVGDQILRPPFIFSADDEFINYVLTENDSIFINPECLDLNFFEDISHAIDGEAVASILIIPCRPPCEKNPLFLTCLVNSNQTDASVEVDEALIKECFRYCSPMLRNTLNQQQFRAHHDKCKEIIGTFGKVIPNAGTHELASSTSTFLLSSSQTESISALVPAIKQEFCKIVNVEMCSIFLKETPFLVSRTISYGTPFDFSDEDFLDVKIPLGVSLAGKTGLTGQILSTNKPGVEKSYCNTLYRLRPEIRNLMTFPMFDDEGEIFGVFEICNKIGASKFTAIDEVYGACLSKIYTPIIQQSLDLQKISSVHARKKLLAPRLIKRFLEFDKSLTAILKHTETVDFVNVRKFNFLPSLIPENESIWTTVRIFFDIGVVEPYEIINKRLFRFVMAVKKGHRPHPFHNWFHTFSTVQYMYAVIKNLKLIKRGTIKQLEGFVLVTACLCHHFDFRGTTNHFQLTAGTVLASLYSSPGCISRHYSITQILRLMIQPECDILSNMSNADYRDFVTLLDKMILATDMSEHVYSLPALKDATTNFYKKGVFQNKEPLFNLLMATAEMSDHARPWKHAQESGERSVKEFYTSQYYSLGESVFKWPDINSKPIRADLVIHFNETICQPAFQSLAEIFPPAAEFTHNLEENQKQWRIIKRHLKKIENFELYGEVESDDSDEGEDKVTNEDNESD